MAIFNSYVSLPEGTAFFQQQMVFSLGSFGRKITPGLHPFGKLVVRGVLRTPRLVAVALRASPCHSQDPEILKISM